MDEIQDELGTTGQGAGVIIGDRDETRLNHTINLADGRENEDVTTFQPAGNAKSYSYLLTSGTASVKGFTDEDPDVVRAQHAEVLGKSRAKPVLIVGKYGLVPGTEANFARTLANTRNCERSLIGVTSADASFALDRTGVLDGKSLHAVFGNAVPNLSEIQKLTFNSADPNIFRGVRANGTIAVFGFGLGITNEALAAGIAALPAYNGRQIVVAGAALTGATNKSGTRQIAYDGAVDVPQLEAVSGAVDSFTVTNGNSGNYSVNGGATFTLPITEGALQTNQQNLGGAFAGVVVKGSSVGNTASGKSQTVTGSGNSLSIGGVAVDLTTSESVATLVGRIKSANPTRTTLAGTGTITKAVAGTITSVTVSGAGSAGLNGTYGQTSQTANGVKILVSPGGYLWGFNGTEYILWDSESGGSTPPQAMAIGTYYRASSPNGPYSLTGAGQNPAPTVTANGSTGNPASINITLTDNASAGNVADLPVVGSGYSSASTAPQAPNGSANFKLYYQTFATPSAPVTSGTGAAISRVPFGVSSDVAASTIQQSTGADANFAYNLVTESGDGEWVDFGLNSPSGFHLAVSVIHKQGDGATLGLTIETADADGAGAPVPASIQNLHTFAPFGARGYDIVASNAPVKRLVRVRRTVTGVGEFIFALVLAPRVA